MGWRNSRVREEARGRRSERFGRYGRDFEEAMVGHLTKMQEAGDIDDFLSHAPNSSEDCEGKDFMVAKAVDGIRREIHFGVTISFHSWNESKVRHPKVPQLCFPIATKPETIRKRILELFAAAPA